MQERGGMLGAGQRGMNLNGRAHTSAFPGISQSSAPGSFTARILQGKITLGFVFSIAALHPLSSSCAEAQQRYRRRRLSFSLFLLHFPSFFSFLHLTYFFLQTHISGPRSTALHPEEVLHGARRYTRNNGTLVLHSWKLTLGLGNERLFDMCSPRLGKGRQWTGLPWSCMLGDGGATWTHDSNDFGFPFLLVFFYLFFNVFASSFLLRLNDYECLGWHGTSAFQLWSLRYGSMRVIGHDGGGGGGHCRTVDTFNVVRSATNSRQ